MMSNKFTKITNPHYNAIIKIYKISNIQQEKQRYWVWVSQSLTSLNLFQQFLINSKVHKLYIYIYAFICIEIIYAFIYM